MSLTQEQTDWCNQHLKNWTLNSEGKVDVNGDVSIHYRPFKRFPVSFGTITGFFSCFNCTYLESLEGAPETVKSHFSCANCFSLKTLDGAPETVHGYFSCLDCTSLESLIGAPEILGGSFYCDTETLKGKFYCNGCTSLPTAQHNIINQYNDKKLTWEEAYKILHAPALLQAKDLGIL